MTWRFDHHTEPSDPSRHASGLFLSAWHLVPFVNQDPACGNRGRRRRRLAPRSRQAVLPAQCTPHGASRPGGLQYVGNVGTGWTDADRTRLAAVLLPLGHWDVAVRRTASGDRRRRVEPCLVAEVSYTSRTQADRLRPTHGIG
ncbi:hypothetical protein [Streptomyces parvus]|uniref:ATP dependent DNA ligase n=1 Tax=Streptomyces parvus TaxID=66428 RepID=UPI0033F290DC